MVVKSEWKNSFGSPINHLRNCWWTGDLPYGSCQVILTDNLGVRRLSAEFVPSLLTDDQKVCRQGVCVRTWKGVWKWALILSIALWLMMKNRCTVMIQNFSHPNGYCQVRPVQKSTTGSVKCENNDDCFFWHSSVHNDLFRVVKR